MKKIMRLPESLSCLFTPSIFLLYDFMTLGKKYRSIGEKAARRTYIVSR
jgi:hypothetical protein